MKNSNTYLTYKVGQEYYAAKVDYINNILEYTSNITKLPDSPDYITGVINLRGEVLPVIDLSEKFGLGESMITVNSCILVIEVIIEGEHVKLGALVNEVDEVIEIQKNDIKEPPKISKTDKNSFILGVYRHDDKFILISDLDKMFTSDSITVLTEA